MFVPRVSGVFKPLKQRFLKTLPTPFYFDNCRIGQTSRNGDFWKRWTNWHCKTNNANISLDYQRLTEDGSQIIGIADLVVYASSFCGVKFCILYYCLHAQEESYYSTELWQFMRLKSCWYGRRLFHNGAKMLMWTEIIFLSKYSFKMKTC